jgi:hypothetical protein
VCSVARRANKTSTLRRSWIILLPPQTTNCYTNGNGRVIGNRHVPTRESVGTHTRRTSDTLPSAGRCCRRGTRLVPEATIETPINQTVSSSPASPGRLTNCLTTSHSNKGTPLTGRPPGSTGLNRHEGGRGFCRRVSPRRSGVIENPPTVIIPQQSHGFAVCAWALLYAPG